MRDYEKFLEQIERVIHQYNQRENKKKSYGTDDLLTQTEIHIVAVIGEQPGIGVKALAKKKGVTAGAASQMIKKMVKKELIYKQISAESEAKIELFLTEKGRICFTEHQKIHEEANKKWYSLFDKLDDNAYGLVTQMVNRMEAELYAVKDERIK